MSAFRSNWRFLALAVLFSLAFSVLVFRSYQLQLEPENKVAEVAKGQLTRRLKIQPRRASILDRNGRSLAVSVESPSVFIDPKIIKNPRRVASRLSSILKVKRKDIEELIRKNKNKRFVWVKRSISRSEEKKVQTLDMRGVAIVTEYKRDYVLGPLASSVLGFISSDGRGLGGIEAKYDDFLSGEVDTVEIKRDARGRPIFEKISTVAHHRKWRDLKLTIDADLQYLVEKYLGEAIQEHQARSGVAVVMEPRSGEVLALADLPNFDPNHIAKYPSSYRRNSAITDPVEPGSVLKVFGVAEALDLGVVTPESIIQTPDKHIQVAGKIIRDAESSHERKQWSVSDLIKFSSNVAVVKLAQKLGIENLRSVYEKVGFDRKTGIDLPGESKGIFHKWPEKHKLEWATMSFGQGIALTPLQITAAYAQIANGGTSVTPRLLYQVREGQKVSRFDEPMVLSNKPIWKRETIDALKKMLTEVVSEDGTGKNAMVIGYNAAGKTGTAQKVDFEKGGYKSGAYWSSFVGFAPVENPKVVVYVMLNEPEGKFYYGGTVAAPVFSKVVHSALRASAIRDVN